RTPRPLSESHDDGTQTWVLLSKYRLGIRNVGKMGPARPDGLRQGPCREAGEVPGSLSIPGKWRHLHSRSALQVYWVALPCRNARGSGLMGSRGSIKAGRKVI